MFGKKHPVIRKRSHSFGIVRTLMSLIMISILSLGVYSAYKSFSGLDPLKLSPEAIVSNLFKNESVYQVLTGILSFSPKTAKIIPQSSELSLASTEPSSSPKPKLEFSFAVVADSENDNDDLKKALSQAKTLGASFVVGLGDWSAVGTINELKAAKDVFDNSGLKYYLIPGDHDAWESRTKSLSPASNFKSVFGQNYQTFSYQGNEFILLDNSDNYYGVDQTQMNWLEAELDKVNRSKPPLVMVFVSTPLYHPSSDHFMGDIEPKLKVQADTLAKMFKDARSSNILAGNTHFFSSYTDPKFGLGMTAVGAITQERNLQDPRFVMVDIYSDSSYNITDTSIK